MNKIKNYLTQQVVLIAPDRLKRPNDYKGDISEDEKINNCPFCKNNRNELSQLLYKSENESCIILKNKFPATETPNTSHEVIIDSNNHNIAFHDNSIEDMKSVFEGIKLREQELFLNENVKCIQIFKNYGDLSGASLHHSHMQLVSLDYIPKKLQIISDNMSKYKTEYNKCYICDLEESIDIFTVYENETFKIVVKADSLMCYTVDILPKRHISIFNDLTNAENTDLCKCIKVAINAINEIKKDFSYNFIFYTSPRDNKINGDYHMFVQIVPRLYKYAGFEISTNDYINSVDAKKYGEILKDLINKKSNYRFL